jgi:serine/threonine protein kinase
MSDTIEDDAEKGDALKNEYNSPIDFRQNNQNPNFEQNNDYYYENENLNIDQIQSSKNIEYNNENDNYILSQDNINNGMDNKIVIKNIDNPDNINKINIISNDEDEKNTEIESNEYQVHDSTKTNGDYDDTDIRSCRLTERNNNNKYLLIKEEGKHNRIDLETYIPEDEDEGQAEKENLFPFRIIGDVKKKSELLGKYNSRYIELDSGKGLFKRYRSSKEYPKNPKEVIDIRNFKVIRKVKRIKQFYDLEITYTETNKKGKTVDKVENFRLSHVECRDKWYDSMLLLWKYYSKGEPIPKITKDFLLFVDDRIGLMQEIGKKNEKNKVKKSEINLKKFQILKLLGVGGFGTVFKVKHILTDKIYAMKVMNKNYIIKKKYLHYVVSEFEIMKSLSGFPFILDVYYCFQSANYLYLIIDYCPNGDFTRLKSINNLKLFFAEVILAFEHIHNHDIIYRDLKPENILLDETGHIRLADFNLAKAGVPKNKKADSFCGSPMYFSPEMVEAKGVDYRCDIFGIGLLIYEVVTGIPAFKAKNIKELYEIIKRNEINFNAPGLEGDIKDLLQKILVKDPDQRYNLDDIKSHPFFKDIDFDKVYRKEYGRIETEKIKKRNRNVDDENEIKENKIEENKIEENKVELTEEEKAKKEYEEFKLQQKKLDDNKEYSFLQGKVTVKEMNLDQKRVMKNFVRGFYYVKKENMDQSNDFKLEAKEDLDISSLIMDDYEAQ